MEDFDAAMKPRPKASAQKNKALLNAALAKFTEAIDEIDHFNFGELDTKIGTPAEALANVFWHFEQRVAQLEKAEQLGTAEGYRHAAAALKEYSGRDSLQFAAITPKLLQGFEDFMVNTGRSLTTVSIYVRNLRAIYRRAYSKETHSKSYPFGPENEGKYVIPASSNPKKALQTEQLRQLLEARADNESQERARDFFVFSYFGNGMNTRDIAKLTFDKLSPNPVAPVSFNFVREKSKRKGSSPARPITVYMNEFMIQVYRKYANDPRTSPFVFPILNEEMTAVKKRNAAKNFTKSINQNIQKLCKTNGIPPLSSNWARHSFITHLLQNGTHIEMVAELAGHESSRTTMGYNGGQREDAKRTAVSTLWELK
jgi:integrase/recombinase XerD